jgi:DNA polymerase-3 subunit delta'
MSLAAPDALALLLQAHAQNRLAHAYLVTGAQGSGKRDLALKLCAKVLGCAPEAVLSHPDVHSIAPESKSRKLLIEQLRGLEGNLRMRSSLGGSKFGIIFEADRLAPQAANAFLKTLEEPPPGTHLLLLSELPEQLLETILSRCVEIPLRATQESALSPSAEAAAQIIVAFFSTRKPDLQGGLWMAQQLQALLAETKERIHDAAAESFKAEEKRLKQTVDPKWLEQLEESHAARTEALYIGERNRLLEVLEAFWTDVLLVQNGQPARHLSVCAAEAARVAQQLSADAALNRVEAITKMRQHLGMTGVNEPLALEHGILSAFAPEG